LQIAVKCKRREESMTLRSFGHAYLLLLIGLLAFNLTSCITPQPRVAPPAGIYQCPQIVTLTDARANAAIYYTTDGSAPTTASSRYTAPFPISVTDQVRAIALAPGSKVSTIASVTYTCAPSLTVAGFAATMQKRFSLPQPPAPVRFADLAPSDPNYTAAQAITPYLNRQVLCPGCMLSANFFPGQALPRAGSAVFFVSYLMAQNKVQLVSSKEADSILASAADAKTLPSTARRFIATAIKIGILPLHEGNSIDSASPFSPEELNAALQTIQTQYNLPPAGPQ
jgi:hypothetical protein